MWDIHTYICMQKAEHTNAYICMYVSTFAQHMCTSILLSFSQSAGDRVGSLMSACPLKCKLK